MTALFADSVLFTPTAGGTTDWTFSGAVQGYQSMSAAGMVNGQTYAYRAESSDLSQWEIGTGVYNSGTGVLTRATVLYNSSGTTSKISFTAAPQVGIVALSSDLGSPGQHPGTGTNDNASSGNVGEYKSTVVTTPVSLSSGTGTAVATLSLPAGDWDVSGWFNYLPAGSTTTSFVIGAINTTSGNTSQTPTDSSSAFVYNTPLGAGANISAGIAPCRISLASTTNVFLNVNAQFATSTATATAVLRARRMR